MMSQTVDVLLVTVTRVEARAVLALSSDPKSYHIGDQTYHDLGVIEGARIAMVQSEMGAGGQGGAILTIQEAIAALHPSAVIMVGIAFGINEKKQQIGDILVSSPQTGTKLPLPGYSLFLATASQSAPGEVMMTPGIT